MSTTDTNLEARIAELRRFRSEDPSNLLLLMELGDLHMRAGQLDRARATYEAALTVEPNHAPARSRVAAVLQQEGRFDEAAAAMRTLIDAGERAPELQCNLGLALCRQDRWEEAAQCFELAVEGGLAHPSALGGWTRCLHHLQRLPEALAMCRRWLQAAAGSPSELEARGYLALLHIDGGDRAEGVAIAREILRTVPDDEQANVVIGTTALADARVDEAQTCFERALAANPRCGRAWQGRGLLALHRGELGAAVAALEEAVLVSPEALGSLNALGWAKLLSLDLDGAKSAFERAAAVDRNFGESHGGLAALAALTGQRERARHELRIARRLSPQGFASDFAEAVLMRDDGDGDSAADVIRGAMLRQLPTGGTLAQHLQAFASTGEYQRTETP